MKRNSIYKASAVVGLAGVLALGAFSGMGAYFTSTSSASDTYTIGQVEIEMSGESNDFAQTLLLPLQEYAYTREIENTGLNDAYVFMTITIPYTETLTVNALDGTVVNQSPYTQVLTFGHDNVSGVEPEFALVRNGKLGNTSIDTIANYDIAGASETRGVVDEDNQTITYIYAYVDEDGNIKPLAPTEKTGNIFEYMKVANLADTFNMKEDGLVQINAYAIQTNNILTDQAFKGLEDDGTEDIEKIWNVINNATHTVSEDNTTPDTLGTSGDADVSLFSIDTQSLIDENTDNLNIIPLQDEVLSVKDLAKIEMEEQNNIGYHSFS